MTEGMGVNGGNSYIYIRVNGVNIKVIEDSDDTRLHTVSGILPIDLDADDEVTLYCYESSRIFAEDLRPFSFIGVLISEITTI